MKTNHPYYLPLLLVITTIVFSGCKKQDDLLNAKPNQALNIPSTLADLQLLIGNENIFNRNYPSLGLLSTDDYFVDAGLWASSFASGKNAYVWAKEIYSANTNVGDWNFPYQAVYYANTILSILPTIHTSNSQQTAANTIKGSALFYRAISFYNLVQTFAMPYDSTTAAKDLGVPLPLMPDLSSKLPRSTESQCYEQIINDLNSALPLLADQSTSKTRPSKAAVLGLLSRIYLVMGNYNKSLKYATDCLALYNKLQDFNKLDPSAFPVYPNFSPEEIFHASMIGYDENSFSAQVDSNVYHSFNDPHDLRLAIFFYNNNGEIEFNSQFDFNNANAAPIATNEIMLTKAECEARLNSTSSAMSDLNALLVNRWVTGTYKPLVAVSADDALKQILKERRKELLFTGLRWSDLRRLNKDTRFAITLYRNINGVTYSIAPNDPRYALPIPDNEIALNPIPQNPR
ncbi:RagB/SusD family nutrient uptake outer membrane protein [Mucilaginibacter mali]|uniref:RagB/SusD family nutrient uptake outer membrane protein n=1 Tax=Mucilaginibacter mali TaxID=2740462 RepID=A0A7D4PRS6_9SPHI|nr:RagB/SusD family nutrient uptake outer membrane protein [Mucilaginibacter mali]QKJ28403.1 RagB/SusD family nutrient uptake outer membrane protein [Mucilaginibacter mali]